MASSNPTPPKGPVPSHWGDTDMHTWGTQTFSHGSVSHGPSQNCPYHLKMKSLGWSSGGRPWKSQARTSTCCVHSGGTQGHQCRRHSRPAPAWLCQVGGPLNPTCMELPHGLWPSRTEPSSWTRGPPCIQIPAFSSERNKRDEIPKWLWSPPGTWNIPEHLETPVPDAPSVPVHGNSPRPRSVWASE